MLSLLILLAAASGQTSAQSQICADGTVVLAPDACPAAPAPPPPPKYCADGSRVPVTRNCPLPAITPEAELICAPLGAEPLTDASASADRWTIRTYKEGAVLIDAAHQVFQAVATHAGNPIFTSSTFVGNGRLQLNYLFIGQLQRLLGGTSLIAAIGTPSAAESPARATRLYECYRNEAVGS